MLTLQKLKDMEPGTIIADGLCFNSPDDIYMSDSNIGKQMIWVAKRGRIHDWVIYIGWMEKGIEWVLTNGDKVQFDRSIKKLVPCDDEALGMYRH